MKLILRHFLGIAAGMVLVTGALAADLTKLESLTPAQAESIAQHVGRTSLDGLKVLPVEIATILARHEGPLSLDGLTQLSPDAAAALAAHKPVPNFGRFDLSLNGLKSVSPATAEALATHRGILALYSLETLDSLPLAKKLAGQSGELRLGLTSLSPVIATELAKNEGVFEDRSRPGVVERRGDLAPSILRLDDLAALSPQAAEALSAHQGILVLNGLTSLDPKAAAALARRKGGRMSSSRLGVTLVMNRLPTLSPECATALAAFPGELVLNSITEISPETAAALAKHKGRLYLMGLKTINSEVLRALQAHPNLRLARGIEIQK